jgi:hypothetical protein
MNPQDLGASIMENYTWKARLSYKWHQFRMMTSSKYRNQDENFTQDLIKYLKESM